MFKGSKVYRTQVDEGPPGQGQGTANHRPSGDFNGNAARELMTVLHAEEAGRQSLQRVVIDTTEMGRVHVMACNLFMDGLKNCHLTYLLDNAVRYSDHGHIRVEVDTLPHPDNGFIRLSLTVLDTGHWIRGRARPSRCRTATVHFMCRRL